MTALRLGSLCTGISGLDKAVASVLDVDIRWHSDIHPAASAVLAHRYPDIPNLGDFTALDWSTVEPVDIITAGYPCQPFSVAGARRGVNDERHLWPYIAAAVRHLQPWVLVFENVRGHLTLGFDVVLGSLASLGFNVEWSLLRASAVGGCHARARLFIVATNPDQLARQTGRECVRQPSSTERPDPLDRTGRSGGRDLGSTLSSDVAPNSASVRRNVRSGLRETGSIDHRVVVTDSGTTPANTYSSTLGLEPVSVAGSCDPTVVESDFQTAADPYGSGLTAGHSAATSEPRQSEHDAQGSRVIDWGIYASAIRRWEFVSGRPAPHPVRPSGALSPRFVEWMMGFDAGWVCDSPADPDQPDMFGMPELINGNDALHVLGNAVMSAQGAHAISGLLTRAGVLNTVDGTPNLDTHNNQVVIVLDTERNQPPSPEDHR